MCRWNILLRTFILAGIVGGDRLFHKFPVYIQILERDIFCSANPVFIFLDVIEAAVFHAYIINVLVIIKSDDEYTEFALLASHVFEVYVAYGRGIAAIALFPVFVLQVDAQYGFAALADSDVAYKYILYQSATAGTGLDADYAVQVGAVHAAVLNEQVAVAAGYFTADNDAAMTVYNPQIQISAESETKRSIFREKDKTKRSKKESAQHSKSRNKSFVMTSVSAL